MDSARGGVDTSRPNEPDCDPFTAGRPAFTVTPAQSIESLTNFRVGLVLDPGAGIEEWLARRNTGQTVPQEEEAAGFRAEHPASPR